MELTFNSKAVPGSVIARDTVTNQLIVALYKHRDDYPEKGIKKGQWEVQAFPRNPPEVAVKLATLKPNADYQNLKQQVIDAAKPF